MAGVTAVANPPPLQTILRQAEERTQLVVECARLVNRLEQLEAEMADFSEWQNKGGQPSTDYRSRVQRRFDEARKRELTEAKKFGGSSPRVPLRGSGRWRLWEGSLPQEPRLPTSTTTSTNYSSSGVGHALTSLVQMKQALEAVDAEAGLWRQQCQEWEAEAATERERARTERLTQFKLSEALKTSEEDRVNLTAQVSTLRGQLHERDLVFDQLEGEYRTLKLDYDRKRNELAEASKQAEAQAHTQRQLQSTIAARERELAAAKRDVEEARAGQRSSEAKELSAEASKRQLHLLISTHEREVAALKRELEAVRKQLEEAKAANAAQAAKQAQMEDIRKDLNTRKTDIDALRTDFEQTRAEAQERGREMQGLKEELDSARTQAYQKLEAALAAERRAEHLQARCENLEAALASATSRQADAAWETKVQKERADNLQEVSRRLLKDLEAGSWQKVKGVPFAEVAPSPASTTVPPEESSYSTPRTPTLPRMRPMSAPRQRVTEVVREPVAA
mmetsp:Transcript_69210/g.165956  ORF Transcript_69210/g.165956 Transcript_69210/m.165956 type:complete len:508 (+) Transcript_69210:70-1593(+)